MIINNRSVEQMFVGMPGVAHATAADAGSVVPGEIAIFKEDWTPLAAGETITDSLTVYIVQGTVTGNRIATVRGAEMRTYLGEAYRAATVQCSHLGYNGTTGSIPVVEGGEYVLRITFRNQSKVVNCDDTFYNYIAPTGATQQTIADAIAAQINALNYKVTATVIDDGGGNYGIKITATGLGDNLNEDVDVTFLAGLRIQACPEDNPFRSQAIQASYDGGLDTIRDYGVGACPMIARSENRLRGYRGHEQYKVWQPAVPTYINCALCYDVITLEWDDRVDGHLQGSSTSPHALRIVIPQGETAPIIAVLDPWMNSVERAFPAVTI